MKRNYTLLICIIAITLLVCVTSLCGCNLFCKHEWVEASCEVPKTCSLCQKTEGEAIGYHTWADATCETPKTCSVCQKTDGEPLGHTWADATCETPKTCSVCQKTDGEPLGHTWTDATCETPKTCSVCQKTDGEPLGHTWADATCETPKTCSVCQKTDGEPLGHTWADATCEIPKTCSTCQKTDGAPLGHSWNAATCETSKTCSTCQKTDGAPLGHSWNAATCETPKTCSVCQKTEGDPLGHTWANATCEIPKTCSTCQKTDGAPLGHNWNAATCETPKTCSTCQKTEGAALGHSYSGSITTSPTCSVAGTKTFTCTSCNHAYTESYTMPVYSASEIHNLYVESIGEIITYTKSGQELALGTCFVYSSDGKLITNYHVIENAYSAKVTINGQTYTVQYILAYDKNIDIAVLQISATGLKAVTVCNSTHAVGSAVYAFGSSKGLSATFSQGIITYSDRELNGVTYVQHDAAISSGNSGGPLINQYGEVIGINTLTVKDSQNLNFAINISQLSKLNYSTPLTFSEYYNKECDVFTRMKNYIVENGSYAESMNAYKVILYSKNSSDGKYKYTTIAYYFLDTNIISLDFRYGNNTTNAYYYIYFEITPSLGGEYNWYYFDSYDCQMRGVIHASTYTSNHVLGYNYTNASSTSELNSTRNLASSMMDYLLSSIDYDWAYIGVTAEDLGFYYY